MNVLADVRMHHMQGRRIPILAIAIGLSCLVHAGLYTGAKNVPVHALAGDGAATFRVGLFGSGEVKDDSAELIRNLATPPSPSADPPVEPPAEPEAAPPPIPP